MKKKQLLILACITVLFGTNSFANEIYNIGGENYSY